MVMYQTYYAAATQRLHKRLDLNRNAETLLRTYDDFKLGKSDRDALGRMVRGSPGNRRAIADTIDHLAETIVKRPEDADACLKLIHIYTEILKIAGMFFLLFPLSYHALNFSTFYFVPFMVSTLAKSPIVT